MEDKDDSRQTGSQDPQLDTPSEANREKHINFMEEEEKQDASGKQHSSEWTHRQKEWKEGIEEGNHLRQSGKDA